MGFNFNVMAEEIENGWLFSISGGGHGFALDYGLEKRYFKRWEDGITSYRDMVSTFMSEHPSRQKIREHK